MEIQEKLEHIFGCIEKMGDDGFFNYFAIKERKIEKMELSFTEEDIWYETRLLSLLLCGALMEINALKNNSRFECFLLANSVNKGRYLIDKRKQVLSQFLLLKYISLSEKDFTFRFFDILDVKKIDSLSHLTNGEEFFSCQGNKIVLHFDLGWDESILCKLLIMAGELVTRVHQGRLVRRGNRVVKLGFYQPFFNLITGKLETAKVICENLQEMRRVITRGFMPKELIPTNTTWKKSAIEKRYRIQNQYLGEHIEYCVYIPKEYCFVIRFGIPIDVSLVSKILAENGFLFGDEERREIKWGSWVRKGGTSRPERHKFNVSNRSVFLNGVKILEIQSNHIVKISIGGEFEKALDVFSLIYNNRAFISGWFETHEASSDLSEFEKLAIMNVDDIMLIYSHFVHSLFYRKWVDAVKNEKNEEIVGFNPSEDVETAVYRKLCECNDGTHNFYFILNSFLLNLQPLIDEEFGFLMKLKESETKERTRMIYDKYRYMLVTTGELSKKAAS